MAKFKCPYCYAEHNTDDLVIYCTSSQSCPNGVTRASDSQVFGKEDKSKCIRCNVPKKYVCPVTWNAIPGQCTDSKNFMIALAGGYCAGQSSYLGVLINEIKKMSRSFGTSLDINCDPETKMVYNDIYYRTLYKECHQLGATDRGSVPPMIFPLQFSTGDRLMLSFYDSAPEIYEDEARMSSFSGYLPYVDGIIMLLDPLQIPEIREKLEGKLRLPMYDGRAFELTDKFIRFIEQTTNNFNAKKRFDMPIAFVINKIDILEPYEDILPADSCLRRESEHLARGAFIQQDFEEVQEEMTMVFGKMLDDNMNGFFYKLKRFKNFALFGISALGSTPDAGGKIVGGVKPRRVLDPFLWLLAQNKYIKTVKK